MPEPHRIRLRRPWRHDVCAGAARWQRHFNRPTGLGADHQVCLVWQTSRWPAARVLLNGRALAALESTAAEVRFDISGRLAARNELTIEIAGRGQLPQSEADRPPGEVVLEISG